MSEKFSYHTLTMREENEYERWLGEQTMKVFCPRLSLRQIDLYFIAEDRFGNHVFENPINGFCPNSGREIFIRRGLDDRVLVLAIVHELRHAWQLHTRKHCTSKDSMERDCLIYEYEINPPKTPKEIRRWLMTEELFDKDPSLRHEFDYVDRLMREAATKRENPTGSASLGLRPERGKREYAAFVR